MNDTQSRLLSATVILLMLFCADSTTLGGDWPAWHGDAASTGQTPIQIGNRPQLLWKTHIGARISAGPVAVNGRIFVSTDSGLLVCTDKNGTLLWQQAFTNTAGESLSTPSSPVCIADTVFICSETGTLHALDASTGDARWTTNTGATVLSSPAYVGATNGTNLFVIDQPSGGIQCIRANDGGTVWRTQGETRTDGPLSQFGDLLVFGSCDSAVHAVSIRDGQPLGSVMLGEGCEIAGGVAVSDGHAFTGNRGGSVVCVDLNTRQIVWTNADSNGQLFTTPAVAKDRVVVTDGRGDIVCLNRVDGTRLWAVETRARDPRSPVIAGDHVVVSLDGSLVILKLDTGERVWQRDISDDVTGPAIVTGGLIVVGTDEGDLLAFGPGNRGKP